MLKVLELFGGIGACSKALERLGIDYEIADYVEIDKYAVKSFNAIHNTNFEPQDITQWDKDIEVDLVMHGSPCQDFSLAGLQAGGDEGSGTRSSLMYETIRIVKKLKPKYVIWENVKNLLSKKHRHNFDAYLETMESLGYQNYYQVLNAKDYGIPQNRERVFTISILNDDNYVFPKGIENTNKIIEHNPDGKHQQDLIQDEEGLCRCIPAGTHGSTPHLLKTVVRDYIFPEKQELKLKLKDMLEDKVDEKYYLSDKLLKCFMSNGTGKYPRRERFLQNINKENKDVANTIITTEGNKPTCNFIKDTENYIEWKEKGKLDVDCRAYKEEKVTGTIMTTPKNKILIKNATKKGYQEAFEGDSVNLAYPNSKTRRGRVGEQVSQTLQCNDNMGVIEKNKYSEESLKRIKQNIIKNDIANTLTANAMQSFNHNNCALINNDLRIRKLTPKECWRLMGFDDEDFEKASKVNSNSQLYKQAGNSIVVNVLENILKNLLKEN